MKRTRKLMMLVAVLSAVLIVGCNDADDKAGADKPSAGAVKAADSQKAACTKEQAAKCTKEKAAKCKHKDNAAVCPKKKAAEEQAAAAKPVVEKAPAVALKCKYETGSVETVCFTDTDLYENWVEMGKQEGKSSENMRQFTQEVVLRREVEKVENGDAVVKVTVESVDIKEARKFQDKDIKNHYSSTKEGTKSSWRDMPKLAGASYKIKVGCDSSVKEIMGLAELHKSLGIEADDRGFVARIVGEEFIRKCQEVPSLQAGIMEGQPNMYNSPVTNVMIKAQAIKNTILASDAQERDGKQIISAVILGEPVHVLPEGVAAPSEPRDFGRTLIKKSSDMQEFISGGVVMFDVEAGKVISANSNTKALLVLLEENMFGGGEKDAKRPPSGNMMFTSIEMVSKFEMRN